MGRAATSLIVLTFILAGCSKPAEERPLPFEPERIRVVDDPDPTVTQPVATAPAAPAGSSEFECAPGFTAETDLTFLERSNRPDAAGRDVEVSTFDGTGKTVFGLPALYLERHSRGGAAVGVGVYVRADVPTVRRKIAERFPRATSNAEGFAGEGPRHPMTLQDAEQGLLFIQCVAA